jgi:hypothetical protein
MLEKSKYVRHCTYSHKKTSQVHPEMCNFQDREHFMNQIKCGNFLHDLILLSPATSERRLYKIEIKSYDAQVFTNTPKNYPCFNQRYFACAYCLDIHVGERTIPTFFLWIPTHFNNRKAETIKVCSRSKLKLRIFIIEIERTQIDPWELQLTSEL